ncbi:amidophosphoribosyltransferase, partial [Vibrio alfacsensis]
ITLAHNGNLTNAHEVREKLFEKDRRHVNTTSDSEVLLNVLAHEIDTVKGNVTSDDVFRAVTNVHRTIKGAYAVAAM